MLPLVVLQVLEAVLERLQDFEDKVRSRAIIAICEAAMAFPEVSFSNNVRQDVTQRWLYFSFCTEAYSISVSLRIQAACLLSFDWYHMHLVASMNQH